MSIQPHKMNDSAYYSAECLGRASTAECDGFIYDDPISPTAALHCACPCHAVDIEEEWFTSDLHMQLWHLGMRCHRSPNFNSRYSSAAIYAEPLLGEELP